MHWEESYYWGRDAGIGYFRTINPINDKPSFYRWVLQGISGSKEHLLASRVHKWPRNVLCHSINRDSVKKYCQVLFRVHSARNRIFAFLQHCVSGYQTLELHCRLLREGFSDWSWHSQIIKKIKGISDWNYNRHSTLFSPWSDARQRIFLRSWFMVIGCLLLWADCWSSSFCLKLGEPLWYLWTGDEK